jgi:hypothetical protein
LQLGNALLKRIEFFLKHPENAPAGGSATVADAKDLGKLRQRESEPQCMAHGLHALQGVRRIQAIP